MSYSNNTHIRIGGTGSYTRKFWEDALKSATPQDFLRDNFKCQTAVFLGRVCGHDDANRITKFKGWAKNVYVGTDDERRLWVFRPAIGLDGVLNIYQSTPIVKARACIAHLGEGDDRSGILLKTSSGSTHWVLPGEVLWQMPEDIWW